jgi:hypothetical protein
MELFLNRGKNRRWKTARPFFSSLFSSLHSSPGLGLRPGATKIIQHFFIKKIAKISISFKKIETLPNFRWRYGPFVQVSSQNLYI